MNEEPIESPLSGRGPEEVVKQSTEKGTDGSESISKVASPLGGGTDGSENISKVASPLGGGTDGSESISKVASPLEGGTDGSESISKVASPLEGGTDGSESISKVASPLEGGTDGSESISKVVSPLKGGTDGSESISKVASPLEGLAPSASLVTQENLTAAPVESGPGEENSGAKAPGGLDTQENLTATPVESGPGEENSGAKAPGGEPPVDWFEPLEEDDDDAQSWDLPVSHLNGRKDAEEESMAGASEKSVSLASGEKTLKKIYQLSVPRRKRTNPDEGWEDWPALGQGWKRKEVIRRSGTSIGQKDVYYLSPRGERLRSRVELAAVMEGVLDLSTFEFKSGKFHNGIVQPVFRRKRKMRERSSSESSWMERGEGADTPDSHHRLTPSSGPKPSPKPIPSNQSSPMSHSLKATPNRGPQGEDGPKDRRIKLPQSALARLLPSTTFNGQLKSEDIFIVCSKCGNSFTGTFYDKHRKTPVCPRCCATSKLKERQLNRFRKWIPCGQCVACHTTVNCGKCANCKHGLQSPEIQKGICRKRKCICPIRKQSPRSGSLFQQTPEAETFDHSMSFQLPSSLGTQPELRPLDSVTSEPMEPQHSSYQTSDTEDFTVNVDVDDDEEDMSTDDDDDWHKKRKRRSCGKCQACLCRKDCGTCDFCIDKPKFGGSNKKRQKCRLRQCQRQAMRHLLPEFGHQDSSMYFGRPRPQHTYSRKTGPKTSRPAASGLEFSDNEDHYSNLHSMSWSAEPTSSGKPYDMNYRSHHSSLQVDQLESALKNGVPEGAPNTSMLTSPQLLGTPHASVLFSTQDRLNMWDGERSSTNKDVERLPGKLVEEQMPMVTRIVSLAENTVASGMDKDDHLLKLLEMLRTTALPMLWSVIMVDGPRLQLIQCSKRSNMIDTMVLIDPGYCYQVTVQNQPLLVTHPLYDDHPARLTSVTEAVNLLLDLERYRVCQGLPAPDLISNKGPVIFERASTCDFLVPKDVKSCANCRALCE